MEDNQACIAMSNNPITHKRTEHIDVRFYYVREKVKSKEVVMSCQPWSSVHAVLQHDSSNS